MLKSANYLKSNFFLFYDETIIDSYERIIQEAIEKITNFIRIEKSRFVFFKKWHESAYIDKSGELIFNESVDSIICQSWDPKREQIYVNQAISFLMSAISPKHASNRYAKYIIFTNRDLFCSGTDFIIGGVDGNFAIISFLRLAKIKEDLLQTEALKTEIFHEIGHLLNIPSKRRGVYNLDNRLGDHCKNLGCSMRQGFDVPEDWILFTKERLKNDGNPYCSECMIDLIQAH